MTTRAAAAFAAAEAALDAGRPDEAAELLTVFDADESTERADLDVLLAESWRRLEDGDVTEAAAQLAYAKALTSRTEFDEADRARVTFQLGCCRLKLGLVPEAVQLFGTALELCPRSGEAFERLRGEILCWRTRSYRRQREWDAARVDAEAAIKIADRLDDAALLGDAYLQASQVAERTGQLLIARFYAERAAESFERAKDATSAGKALNNVGGLSFLLGDVAAAKETLKRAFAIALQHGNDVDAAYAVSSTAQVMLRTGDAEDAERNARYALELLLGRDDHVNEIGNAQLVLGRALAAQRRIDEAENFLQRADESFDRMGSIGHRSAVWLAQGDVAAERGDLGRAATAYRRAAEALQDVRF
jgi:tetratricopeptide (TPR) repeat protein